MGLIEDFNNAVALYPVDYVDLEFVDFDFDGDVLNKHEVAEFRVQVTNRGPLNMTGVKLHIVGQHGAKVAGTGTSATFSDDIVADIPDPIPANGGSVVTTGGRMKLQAPDKVQDAKALMRATLKAWDADLNFVLVDNTTALSEPKANFVSAVADQ
jgi:hypothetical protein